MPFGGLGMAGALRSLEGVQNESDQAYPTGQAPPGPGWRGTGKGCAQAVTGSRRAKMMPRCFMLPSVSPYQECQHGLTA